MYQGLWSNSGKGVAPFPIPRCSNYWKGNFRVTLDHGRQVLLIIKWLMIKSKYWIGALLLNFIYLILLRDLTLGPWFCPSLYHHVWRKKSLRTLIRKDFVYSNAQATGLRIRWQQEIVSWIWLVAQNNIIGSQYIHIYICVCVCVFSERGRCANKTVVRKAHSLLMTLILFIGKEKEIRQKLSFNEENPIVQN